jgi:hypothetical protein
MKIIDPGAQIATPQAQRKTEPPVVAPAATDVAKEPSK